MHHQEIIAVVVIVVIAVAFYLTRNTKMEDEVQPEPQLPEQAELTDEEMLYIEDINNSTSIEDIEEVQRLFAPGSLVFNTAFNRTQFLRRQKAEEEAGIDFGGQAREQRLLDEIPTATPYRLRVIVNNTVRGGRIYKAAEERLKELGE